MVDFNPAKISLERFQGIFKDIETLDKEHELEFDDETTRKFINQTADHLMYYPQTQAIRAALGVLVHQQHAIREFQIDREELTKDNTRLTKEVWEAKEKLEKYEKELGTLTQMK